MKVIFEDKKISFLRFDRGEDVIAGLVDYQKKENLEAAAFSGLGACDQAELSYYDIEKQQYVKKYFKEELEITNLTGNLSWLSGEPAVHSHGSFSRKDFSVIGGHVFSLRVSGTCEIHLNKISEKLYRARDEETGLNLLD